jgi:hypothetical protein
MSPALLVLIGLGTYAVASIAIGMVLGRYLARLEADDERLRKQEFVK